MFTNQAIKPQQEQNGTDNSALAITEEKVKQKAFAIKARGVAAAFIQFCLIFFISLHAFVLLKLVSFALQQIAEHS